MSTSLAEPGIPLAVLCVVMALLAAIVYRVSGIGPSFTVPAAALRGVAQLAAVSLVLTAALEYLWSSLLVLLAMFVAAAITSARRSESGRSGSWLAIPLAAGIGVVVPLCLMTGVVPAQGIAIVPVGGIILGGTMIATSLSARRSLDALSQRRGEVEAALSLGLSERDSRLEVIRPTAADALLPGLDQTRTVGLVTLPGAFVGVLLASGSAIQAGAVQILVLVGILLAQSLAVSFTVEFVARGYVQRSPRVG